MDQGCWSSRPVELLGLPRDIAGHSFWMNISVYLQMHRVPVVHPPAQSVTS